MALHRAQDILAAKKARKVLALKSHTSQPNFGTEPGGPGLEDVLVSHSDAPPEFRISLT